MLKKFLFLSLLFVPHYLHANLIQRLSEVEFSFSKNKELVRDIQEQINTKNEDTFIVNLNYSRGTVSAKNAMNFLNSMLEHNLYSNKFVSYFLEQNNYFCSKGVLEVKKNFLFPLFCTEIYKRTRLIPSLTHY